VGGRSAERFLGTEPASAFSVAEPARTDKQTTYLLFLGFFCPSLKINKNEETK
jgi:hypothetical protein